MLHLSFKKQLLSALACAFIGTAAIPAEQAYADTCDQIHCSKNVVRNACKRVELRPQHQKQNQSAFVQVRNLVSGKATILAEDVACIIKDQSNTQQKKITEYVADKLEDPQNYDVILRAMNNDNEKDDFAKSVKRNYKEEQLRPMMGRGHDNNPANDIKYSKNVKRDACSKIELNVKKQRKDKSTFVQVKDLINGKTTILSSDVACIIKDQNFSQQKKITEYVADKLEDPQNYELITKVMISKDGADDFEKAVRKNYPSVVHQNDRNDHHDNNHGQFGGPMVQQPAANVRKVADKVDYSNSNSVLDQVKLYLGDAQADAADIAEVMNRTSSTFVKTRVAVYAINKLADPDNAYLLVLAQPDSVSRRDIIDAGIKDIPNRKHFGQGKFVVKDAADKIAAQPSFLVVSNTQFVVGNDYVTAADAAKIVGRSESTVQAEVGEFLVKHLIDPENVDLLIKATKYDFVKQRIIKAASAK